MIKNSNTAEHYLELWSGFEPPATIGTSRFQNRPD